MYKQYKRRTKEREEVLGKVALCIFQRKSDSEWEPGLLLNNGALGILDTAGNKVVQVPWDFKECPEFAVDISGLIDRYKNHPLYAAAK